MREQSRKSKRVERPVVIAGIIAAGVWWFVVSAPSIIGWIVASLLLFYLCIGYFYLSLILPAPSDEQTHDGDMIVHHARAPELEDLDKVVTNFWHM